MNKTSKIVIGVIVLAVLIGGGYMLFHKSPKPAASNTSSTNAPAVTNAVLKTKTDSTVGQYLADPSGKPLYTYNADTSGKSNCTGACLSNWPAYQDKGSTKNLPAGVSTITRKDNGQIQYTYMGMPLYYFTADTNGQVSGDGVENFSVAKPSSASTSTQSTQSTDTAPATTPTTSGSTTPYNY